ncbi:MAG: hypothetical protein J1F61_00810 [Clostridiales bacterium]|nr:hypothetical protein [Clostridiales bacterium]
MKLLKNPGHVISLLFTVAFILVSVLCFQNSWLRIGESFKDICTSLAHAFTGAEPTVNKFSSLDLQDLNILPKDLQLFLTKFELYGQTLLYKETYLYFLTWLAQILRGVAVFILFALLPMLALVLIAWLSLKFFSNNKYNQDTVPLQIVKTIAGFTYWPVKRGINAYLKFLKGHKVYPIIWALIWALNFNIYTILFEAIAYYYYFVTTFDFVNLYVQACKLLLDLSTVLLFFPPWAWAIILIYGFFIFRNLYSVHKLVKLEKKSEEIVAELPVAVLITGTMNTGKTTFNTELAITYNKYFRDVADKKMFEITMRFPNFPWINLERCIKYGLEHHTIYNLATCKQFIRLLRKIHDNPNKYTQLKWRILQRRYGYNFENFQFDYDVKRYGFSYYDNLETKTIFDVMESYAQHYFIYVISCSLMLANYSIRVDDFLKDKGNFPLWDINFFRKDPEKIKEHTRHSHILDYEALRLGEHAINNSKFKDSIDFGIIVITEVGKERANQKTVKWGYFTYGEATPDNDLMNLDTKMCRHRATVDNFPYVVYLMDEQRAGSLNADNKELSDILYIVKASDYKFNTSLFALDELIYKATSKLMHKFHKADRYSKGNNTLFRHTLRNAFSSFIFKHYERAFNMYSVSTLQFTVQDGKESNDGKKMKYRLSKKKIHSARFSTDAYADYYYEKTKRSSVGIVDIPEYAGKQATREELNQTHGYFANGMDNIFNSEQ